MQRSPTGPKVTRRTSAGYGIALVATLLGAAGCSDNLGLAGANFTGDESILNVVGLGNENSPEALIDAAMNRYNADERQRGITRIAAEPFGADPVFLQLYRAGVTDADASVRTASARALGLHGESEDALLLLDVLRTDPDRLARWQAGIALQRLHNPQAVDVLIAATREADEQDVQVRAAAAVALGQYAQPRVLETLIAALDDPDLAVNAGARRSLRVLTGRDEGYLPADWLAWSREAEDVFADRDEFLYPAFARNTLWWEHLNPFIKVPNEAAAQPTGMPAIGRR